MNAGKPIDQAELSRLLSPRWVAELPPPRQAEAAGLLSELIADWAREADSDADPAAVNAIQRTELDQAGRDQAPDARLAILGALVLDRRISRLRVRSYSLGTAIIDGKVTAEASRDEGRALLREAEALSTRVRALSDPAAVSRLTGPLGDALMEALFAVEGKAMSSRLLRYQQGRRAPRR